MIDSKKKLFHIFSFVVAFISCFLTYRSFAQVNHGYPRTAIFQWGGASAEWYAKFDLVDFSLTSSSAVKAIKNINPETIVLSTSGWTAYGNPFVITPLPEPWFARDSKGDKIDVGGGCYLVDLTNMCDLYQGKRYNQVLPEVLVKRVNLSVFDGIASDWLWRKPHGVSDIDLDKNGVNDYQEHGENWVISVWQHGLETLLTNLRNLIPDDKLILINSGMFHEFGWTQTNGVLLEHTGPNFYFPYFKKMYDKWMAAAPEPHVLLFDAILNSKNDFPYMRYLLTATLLGDGYFGVTDKNSQSHDYQKYYDEFDVDLGYPTSPALELSNGCWVRFFDNGVSITNPSGSDQIVMDSDLRSFSQYAGPYYRFKGGQDPDFNNDSEFYEVSLSGKPATLGTYGDGIILLRNPTAVVSEIVIDDQDQGTSPASNPAELVGNWKRAWDSSNNFDIGVSFYQMAFKPWKNLFKAAYTQPGQGEKIATYRPTIGVAGNYEIFEWHGYLGDNSDDVKEATNVPYTITYAKGETKQGTIDQSINYGKWNSLGTYHFEKRTEGNVKISNKGTNGMVIADAFKFVYKGGVNPNPPLNAISADFNCDGRVNIQDLGIMLSHWGKSGSEINNYQNRNCQTRKNLDLSGQDITIGLEDIAKFFLEWISQ